MKEQRLFSDEEMRGGVSIDFFDQFTDAYLEALQIVGKLDDAGFYFLSQDFYTLNQGTRDMFFLHPLPIKVITITQFVALRDCINLRHGYNNNFQKPHVTFPGAFVEARKRLGNDNCSYTEWFSQLSLNELI